MIGKQIKGRNFRRLLDYLLSKPRAEVLGGTLYGADTPTLMQQFQVSRLLNPGLQKSVYHVSLSLSPSDRSLSAADWCAIASEYLQQMGFGNSQYVIVQHHDREHPHIHIAASRVNQLTHKAVPQEWDYPRSEKVLRGLEKAYQLQQTPCSWEKLSRSPTTGECRLQKRTGQPSARVQIQKAIDSVCHDAPVLEVMIDRLAQQGITAELHGNGIRYHAGEFHFSGTQLGKAYTLPGLQKHKGIALQPLEPEPAIAPRNRLEPDAWPTVKDWLIERYSLPEEWLDELYPEWIRADPQGNALFIERSLEGGETTAHWELSPTGQWQYTQHSDRPGAFWMGDANGDRAVVVETPIAVLLAAQQMASDRPTLYLCWNEGIPQEWFEEMEVTYGLEVQPETIPEPQHRGWEL